MKFLKNSLITLLVGLGIAFLIAGSKDVFSQTALINVYHILSDSFFVSGVVITGIGLLVFSSNEGTFDMLVYGLRSFFDLFRRNSIKRYESFYDYRTSRQANKFSFGFMLASGLVLLAVAVVMYLLYRSYL